MRFQAWAAMLVGVFGVVGVSVGSEAAEAEKGSDVRKECVGVPADCDVWMLFLTLVTRVVRVARREDRRGGWETDSLVLEDVLEDEVVDVMLEIDIRRIVDG